MAKKKQVKQVSNSVKNTEKSTNIKTTDKSKIFFDFAKKVLPVVLILIVMALAFYVRSGPITLSSMDARVEANIYSNIKAIITQDVNSKYPNLNQFDKQELVQKEYDKVLETKIFQGYEIDKLIANNVAGAKAAFQTDSNQTYLNAIDPYHFMKYTDIYDENGYKGTSLKDGKPWVDYKLAPTGIAGSNNVEFHIWLENKLYNLNGITYESTDGDKTATIYLIPVIFVILSVIPIFLILNKYTNMFSAFFGSLVLVTIGTFVSRTIAGFVDTDAYTVFFSLMVIMFVIFAIFENKLWLKLTYACLAGLFQGLFLWAWSNGWFIFLFSIIALVGYIAYLKILIFIELKKISLDVWKFIKNEVFSLGTFLISSFVFTYLIINQNIFTQVFNGINGSMEGIATISGSNIWPNVLSSVAELNPASFAQIISSVGGKFVFLLALLGLVLMTVDYKKKYDWATVANRLLVLASFAWVLVFMNSSYLIALTANYKLLFLVLLFLPIGVGIVLSLINENKSNNIFMAILLSVWMAGTIYMSFNGVRFILLLAPAFAIAFGIGLYQISKIVNTFVDVEFKPKSFVGKQIFGFGLICVIFGVIFMPMFTQAVLISENTFPNFDDAWYNAMYKIKNESSPEAIITSWWDFGHFFAAIADRGVTFDGGSQTTPQAHWVGKLLMENDEEVAHDILQMLVCGGNSAYETFYSFVGKDNSDAVKINKILYSTFGKENNREILENNKYYDLSDSQIDAILDKLACANPREDYLITSEDMVGKAGVWAHWGSWDFTKKYVHDNYKKLSANQIAENIDENETLISAYVSELQNIDKTSAEKDIKREDLINRWFADYPSYIPIQGKYEFACQNKNNASLVCENSIEIDGKTGKITKSGFGNEVVFRNLYLPGFNNSLNVIAQNVNGNIDAVLVPSSTGLNIMMAQAPLGGSLFTKLFYLDGAGTSYFEKFDEVQSATGVNVKIWKVKWDSSLATSVVE